MADLNRVALVGRLTKDPELGDAGSTKVCNMRLAVNVYQGKDKGEDASFFDVAVFGKQAEAAATHLKKGKQVAVDGKLRQRSYEKDGQKHERVGVVADSVQFMGSKAESESGEGDLPF